MLSTAVPAATVARIVGATITYSPIIAGAAAQLPPQIAVFGQANTGGIFPPGGYTLVGGAEAAGEKYGYGSPIHEVVKELLPALGGGVGSTPIVIFPLGDGTTPAASSFTPSGPATADGVITVFVGSVATAPLAIPLLASVAAQCTLIADAINAVRDMPVTADGSSGTSVTVTAKYGGTAGNDLTLSLADEISPGVMYVFPDMSGGAGDPTVDTQLAQLGSTWFTHIVNTLPAANGTALDAYQVAVDARYGFSVKAPTVVFTGATGDVATLLALGTGRELDRANSVISCVAGGDMPHQYCAAAVREIVRRFGADPAVDYVRARLAGRGVPLPSTQPTFDERDMLVKAGISTTTLEAGAFTLSDTVTFYRPVGELVPGFRYVVAIAKLMTTVYNWRLEFESEKWDGKVLISNRTPTSNPNARKPRNAKAAMKRIVDLLALAGVLSSPEAIKEGIQTDINGTNPNRLDMRVPLILSGNLTIISADLLFSYDFGQAQAA